MKIRKQKIPDFHSVSSNNDLLIERSRSRKITERHSLARQRPRMYTPIYITR